MVKQDDENNLYQFAHALKRASAFRKDQQLANERQRVQPPTAAPDSASAPSGSVMDSDGSAQTQGEDHATDTRH